MIKCLGRPYHTIPYKNAAFIHFPSRTSTVYRPDTLCLSKGRFSKEKAKGNFAPSSMDPPQGPTFSSYLKAKPQNSTKKHFPCRWLQIRKFWMDSGYLTSTSSIKIKNRMVYLSARGCCTAFPVDLREACQRRGRKGSWSKSVGSIRGNVATWTGLILISHYRINKCVWLGYNMYKFVCFPFRLKQSLLLVYGHIFYHHTLIYTQKKLNGHKFIVLVHIYRENINPTFI